MDVTRGAAAELIDSYYASWREGIGSFDETRLGSLLAEDLDFEGPIAGRRTGAAGFIGGLKRFVEGLSEPITMIQRVDCPTGGSALYDAMLPGGVLRFAEFFVVESGRIRVLKLLYDGTQYRALGGR